MGVWKATQDGQTAYYCFDSDGYHLQIKETFEDQTVSVDLLYEANGHHLTMTQIGYQGQLVNAFYEVEEDTMILRHGEESISFERVPESENP